MTTFPNFPRLLKGALIGVEFNPVASVVVLYYNRLLQTKRLEND